MAHRRFRSLLTTAALIAVLLFAQAASIGHLDFDDSHHAGEVCTLCMAHANMGAANVSVSMCIAVDVQRSEDADYLPVQSLHRRVEFHFARGPPLVS